MKVNFQVLWPGSSRRASSGAIMFSRCLQRGLLEPNDFSSRFVSSFKVGYS